MEMADLLELLNERQGDMSDDNYAKNFDINGSTLWRYKNGKTEITAAARKKMIEYYISAGDTEMVGALLAYKTGKTLSRGDLSRLGAFFIGTALVPA